MFHSEAKDANNKFPVTLVSNDGENPAADSPAWSVWAIFVTMVIRWTLFDRVLDVNVLWWVRIALNSVIHMHVLAIWAPEVMVMVVTVDCVIDMVNASDWIKSIAIVAIAAIAMSSVAMTIVSAVVIAIPVATISVSTVAMSTISVSTIAMATVAMSTVTLPTVADITMSIIAISTVSSVMIDRQMVMSMPDVIMISAILTAGVGLTSHSMACHQGQSCAETFHQSYFVSFVYYYNFLERICLL